MYQLCPLAYNDFGTLDVQQYRCLHNNMRHIPKLLSGENIDSVHSCSILLFARLIVLFLFFLFTLFLSKFESIAGLLTKNRFVNYSSSCFIVHTISLLAHLIT